MEEEDDRLSASSSARGYGYMEDEEESDDHLKPQESLSLKFRNYVPQTHLLEGYYTTDRATPGSITHLIQDKLELLKQETDQEELREDNVEENGKNQIDPRTLDLKRIDWDLKRRIERRMERLDRETRKQIDRYTKQQQQQKQKSKAR